MKSLLHSTCALLAVCFLAALPVAAQVSASSAISGAVLDPSGAAIPGAELHLHSRVLDRNTTTDALGHYTLSIPAGKYDLTVEAKGFRPANRPALEIPVPKNAPLNITLKIDTANEDVEVGAEAELSTDAGANKSALVFKGDTLDTFSDDPNAMSQQLQAIAGADPTNPPQIYVDGFSNGSMPPKENIREIRINQNPFASEYDQFGGGRIEIFTKPGTNKLHGGIESNFGTSGLNARNPYTTTQPPSYFNDYSSADLNGPIGKASSFFLSMTRSDLSQNAIINATTLDSSLNPLPVSQSVANQSVSQGYSARIDHQFGKNDTFIGKYVFSDASQPNAGLITQFALPSQAYSSSIHTQTLQLSDTHIFSPKLVLDGALQYIRTRTQQDPSSNAPTLNVSGAFIGGGSSAQALHDNKDNLELRQYFSISHKAHFIRTGLRYRMTRDANLVTSGFNGQFVFTSLTAFQITQRGLQQGQSDAQIRATCQTGSNGTQVCGGASQFSLSAGTPSASLTTGDIGVFAEDEWKATKNLTLNFGIRFESQSAIPDHFDPAPRGGFAYAIKPKNAKTPIAVVRGGFGLFYQRFASNDILQSLRQNGTTEQVYYIPNPVFTCATPNQYPCFNPVVPTPSSLSAIPSTVYRIAPNLRSPMQLQGMATVEHSFGKWGSLSASWYQRRSIYQLTSLNINAPLPSTGVRPLGGTQNVYQYSSVGNSNGHTLGIDGELNLTKYLSAWGFFGMGAQEANVAGADSFPSNSYNLNADAGELAGYPHHQLYTGFNAHPGWDISMFMFAAYRAHTNFNITTGQDNNGDSIYNDRPAFATDLTRASVVRTPYGNFDTAPTTGQTIIPINYGESPSWTYIEAGINKNFHFGPRPSVPATPQSHEAQPSAKKVDLPPQRYRLQVGINADNLFNINNPGTRVGVLTSPFFGRSISLNSPFSNNTAANRALTLRGAFYF